MVSFENFRQVLKNINELFEDTRHLRGLSPEERTNTENTVLLFKVNGLFEETVELIREDTYDEEVLESLTDLMETIKHRHLSYCKKVKEQTAPYRL